MSIFDAYVNKVREYVEDMGARGRRMVQIQCPTSPVELLDTLPIRVGPGASSGLILRTDSFAELGNPEAGSCAFTLWTDRVASINNGRITLIGPDIPECPGASLPFGQVMMAGGANLTEKQHDPIRFTQYPSDRIEGYMVRSSSRYMWCRVSKDAASKGFCFETLGRALMAILRSDVPDVEAVEVVFVTSAKEDLEPLEELSTQVEKISNSLIAENWKAKGFDLYECSLGWDCSVCPDRPVCDDIRQIIKVRKVTGSQGETNPEG
ncbi:MAG: carbon monoxide dehydrogenase [Chloroflexi bacterium]|nr:MAG: carbon monoxide dehydrogenase [Chloroflexota bacterium]